MGISPHFQEDLIAEQQAWRINRLQQQLAANPQPPPHNPIQRAIHSSNAVPIHTNRLVTRLQQHNQGNASAPMPLSDDGEDDEFNRQMEEFSSDSEVGDSDEEELKHPPTDTHTPTAAAHNGNDNMQMILHAQYAGNNTSERPTQPLPPPLLHAQQPKLHIRPLDMKQHMNRMKAIHRQQQHLLQRINCQPQYAHDAHHAQYGHDARAMDLPGQISLRNRPQSSASSLRSDSIYSVSDVVSNPTPHRRDYDDQKQPCFFMSDPRSLQSSQRGAMSGLLSGSLEHDSHSQRIELPAGLEALNEAKSINGTELVHIYIVDPPFLTMEANEDSEEEKQPQHDIWLNVPSHAEHDHVIALALQKCDAQGILVEGRCAEHYELRHYDEDEESIDWDMPVIQRDQCPVLMGLEVLAMRYIGDSPREGHPIVDVKNEEVKNDEAIPEVDWDYAEYEVRDEYSKGKAVCVLGIGRDRIHIVLKSDKHRGTPSPKTDTSRRRFSSMGSRGGSLIPHFTYVFQMPERTLQRTERLRHGRRADRWLDARVLTRQKNHRIREKQREEQEANAKAKAKAKGQIKSVRVMAKPNMAATVNADAVPSLDSVAQLGLNRSVPTKELLHRINGLGLRRLESGICDEVKSVEVEVDPIDVRQSVQSPTVKRRKSSKWVFQNLFAGVFRGDEEAEEALPEQTPNQSSTAEPSRSESSLNFYEVWNTYNVDGRYMDRHEVHSPLLMQPVFTRSGSHQSFIAHQRRRSSVATNISMDNDEFTPLTIELCQKIGVLKRDNKVFEINFLLDLCAKQQRSVSKTPSRRDRSKETTPSAVSNLFDGDDEKAPPSISNLSPRIHKKRFSMRHALGSSQRQILGHSRKGSRRHSLTDSVDAVIDGAPGLGSRQLSNGSYTQSSRTPTSGGAAKVIQPFQADDLELYSDSRTGSESPSRSFKALEDFKPGKTENATVAVAVAAQLKKIEAEQKREGRDGADVVKPNSLFARLAQRPNFHVLGGDKYLTHTVRYAAKSPEDCCQIVRKIQHLMLLENKAMNAVNG